MILQYPDGDGGLRYLDFGGGGEDYSLPTASESVKGGVKIGDGLAMDGDTLSVTLSSDSDAQQMKSFGQIVTVPTTATALPDDLTQLADWQVINAASNGYVFVVLPKKLVTGNYRIAHLHNVDDYSLIYSKDDFVDSASATLGYEIVTLGTGIYALQIPAAAIHWRGSNTQLVIHGEREATDSSETSFVPGYGLEMDGDTLNVTLPVGGSGSTYVLPVASDYTLPVASANVLGGVKIGNGLQMNGDTLNVTLQTPAVTEYTLPTASRNVKGGVKVGDGLEMDGETLNCTVDAFYKYRGAAEDDGNGYPDVEDKSVRDIYDISVHDEPNQYYYHWDGFDWRDLQNPDARMTPYNHGEMKRCIGDIWYDGAFLYVKAYETATNPDDDPNNKTDVYPWDERIFRIDTPMDWTKNTMKTPPFLLGTESSTVEGSMWLSV